MLIKDHHVATQFLKQVSYYRFAGYALPFEKHFPRKRTHRYKPSTSFEMVTQLYEFDRDLRGILLRAIERIEITFRSQICFHAANITKDSHWTTDMRQFDSRFDFARYIEKIQIEVDRSSEPFIEYYQETYDTPEIPASWMLIEILGFGTWSRVYKSLRSDDIRRRVADYFSISSHLLESWIEAITILRNICAHHGRTWNRASLTLPKMTNRMKRLYPESSISRSRIIILLDVIHELLQPIAESQSAFTNEISELLLNYPSIPRHPMGMNRTVPNSTTNIRDLIIS
ncbi:Abortive infection bacteriophage resistance protein [Salinispira pacifica]|uniref:Abortive infection bacteriophage resistance protein n=2 Tax=Salinispira pacifica TaxID=1307761 RepID=V5WK63_9SPIO|nr:Abortive infection bacteriophage resistance protein [Salinispira pacifica]